MSASTSGHSEWFEGLRGQSPSAEALVSEGRRLGYGELASVVAGARTSMRALDAAPGTLVAVLAPPSVEGVVAFHALLDAGLVALPLHLRWTQGEMSSALGRVRPDWLLVTPETQAIGLAVAKPAQLAVARFEADGEGGVRFRVVHPAREAGDTAEQRRQTLAYAGAALALLTSGTSGPPKAAVLSRDALVASARASIEWLGSRPDDRWLLCMPLFHVGGLSVLVRSALAGTSVVLQPRFDAEAVSRALDEERITRVSLVATMLARLLAVRGERPAPETLELVLLGGGPAARSLLERADRLGYPIAPTYGLTEAASQVATRRPGTVGAEADPAAGLDPLPGTELRIVDDAGRPLAADREGEIQVRGPTCMLGYLDDAQATARVIDGEGWLSTGDLGRLDADGRLRVLDRRSDLIVSGGENVYPAEVESVLEALPEIAEAGVVARPDAEFGARPVAVCVPSPGQSLDPPRVLAHCRAHLAAFKVPVAVVVRGALPRTASGKLQRQRLVEELGTVR